MSIFVAGLDLGNTQDYTALVIVEASGAQRMVTKDVRDRETGMLYTKSAPIEMMPLTQCEVRWIERVNEKARYSYTEMYVIVRDRIRELATNPATRIKPRYFALDKTGVGVAVAEMFAELSPIGITITGGNQVGRPGPMDYTVPKRDLVVPAQVLLQNRVMKIAKSLPHAALLQKELLAFRAKIAQNGHDTYEAWRDAEHDDLVLALSMAVWLAETIISVGAMGYLEQDRREDPPSISPI